MNWKPYEPWLHRAMGFGAGLVNLRLLLNRREWRQLPPENDEYPEVVVYFDQDGFPVAVSTPDKQPPSLPRVWYRVVYWASVRVLDTLRDSWDYRVGETAAWFGIVAIAFTVGRCVG